MIHSILMLHCIFLFFTFSFTNAFSITRNKWMYKGHPISYETVGDFTSNKEPILLLNGFGVGSFHQHRLMEKLPRDRSVYGMDYLGQGNSWPEHCQDGMSEQEKGLIYSGDTWVDQAIQFIEQVILQEQESATTSPQNNKRKKVHLVGNSVGGHLAVFLAALRPDLVESVCLLNATPVWGLNLPGWSGNLPAPLIPRLIGRYLFDRMRDLNTIRRFLDNSYANKGAYGEELVQQIRGATEGMGGHAAFASILWSPPVSTKQSDEEAAKSFYDCLETLECDVLMVFGKDDPWCKPAFAKKMLHSLDSRQPEAIHRYVELSNVGHCPNHEAPQAVARLLSNWADCTEGRNNVPLVRGTKELFAEQWGEIVVQERQKDEIQLGIMDRVATAFVG
jgi:pimeloyl-ACP methyl ester carboxylesterase